MSLRNLVLALLCLGVTPCSSQVYWTENFDYVSDPYLSNFVMDTLHANNSWQIGKPNKSVFTTARSLPNVIVTDTSHTYQPNDTSVFYVNTTLPYMNPYFMSIEFYYWLDIDSGSSAKFEISGDRGLHWFDPIAEDTTYMIYWGSSKPQFDTSTHGWENYRLNLSIWARATPGSTYHFPSYLIADTITYRFTFISGPDTVHKDGWMMDDFFMNNGVTVSTANPLGATSSSAIFPNPAASYFCIANSRSVFESAEVLDLTGKLIKEYLHPANNEKLPIDFPEGTYIVKLVSAEGVECRRLTVLK